MNHGALVDADVHRTWSVLRRFGEIAAWHPAIAESRIKGDLLDGMPGCLRVLRHSDGGTLRERLMAMDEANHGITYRFEEAPLPVDDYHLTVSVMPVTGEPRSFICWTARFDVRPGHDAVEQVEVIRNLVAGGHEALAEHLASRK